MRLPKNIVWNQNNLSDSFSDLWSSFNLNLTKKLGELQVSPRLLLNISTTDDAQLDEPPCAFKFFPTTVRGIWAAAGDFLWSSSRVTGSVSGGPNATFIQDPEANSPTTGNSNQSDLEILPDLGYMLHTGASTTVKFLKTDGTWNSCSGTLGNSSGLHAMAYFRALNRIYVVDDNSRSISVISNAATPAITAAAASTQYTLKNLTEGSVVETIAWIRATSTRVWIGTLNLTGGKGRVYSWDGSTGGGGTYGPNETYILENGGSLSCVIKDDFPIIFDVKGRLLEFNGATFKEFARLPFRQEDTPKTFDALGTIRMCHYNGMDLVDGKINILVNTQLYDTNSTNRENVPSGVWEYTEETGLYHKASVGHTKSGGTIVEYGQQKLSLVGALAEVDMPSGGITQGSINGKYMVGARYYITASAVLDGIFYDDTADTLQKAGSFITSKIFSPNVQDSWKELKLRFRRFLNSTDKIVVKYRTEEDEPTEAAITYVDTTSFTVLASAFTTNPAVGDEVEILRGVGAGRTAHITVVTGTTTLTITVDETITGATTQTATARFQTWKKIATYNAQNDEWWNFPVSGASAWVQFKVWILWTGKNEIHDGTIPNTANQLIK